MKQKMITPQGQLPNLISQSIWVIYTEILIETLTHY